MFVSEVGGPIYVLLRVWEERPLLKRVPQLLLLFAGVLIPSLCLRAEEAKVGTPIS